MARLTGPLAAAIVGLTAVSVSAQTRPASMPLLPPILQGQQARLMLGSIQGVVSDERGGPLAGAMVSALGVTTAMATTDARGRFLIQPLPSGDYILRVHLPGFVSTRRDGVRVSTVLTDVSKIQMHRLEDSSPLPTRSILTAGIALPAGDNPTADGDNHSETAWRLRHIARSVLKQDGDVVSIADAAADQPVPDGPGSIFGRAFDNAASLATSFFTATPFSGEVNLLTTSALGAGPLLFSDFVPRGVAYMSIGAPAASGRWDVRASMSQSDVAAWILAGSFTSRIAESHDYGFGVSYSTQQYQNTRTRPIALPASNDDARNVGELYGSDRWTVSPTFAVEYGARYARYDYLRQHSLLSPRVGFTLTPYTNTHVTASVGQRMLAPGAEEFLPPATVGPWLPPERTFAPLEGEDLRVQRTRFYDVGLAHEFNGTYVLGVHRFEQHVDDQLATLFGLPVNGGPKSPGHYYVASAGAVNADGWGVRLSSAPTQRIRGSIDYSLSRTQWVSRGDMAAIAVWAPAAVRAQSEDVHDLTTSLETEVPQTATRVFVLYKINNAFARGNDPTRPALDYRFDVQVNQALPFMPFSGTARWEVLVGLRNLFRDPNDAVSIYDELLVVRPPKRVIGGVLIRF
jgi:Carboxypeptidase regulatory-like domain/TonB dependent receptor-like, beta-barrel